MRAAVWILSIALLAVSFPIAENFHLRNVYRQTLAHWLSKIVPPPTVFIGDSITAGGFSFNSWRDINLAENGLLTYQIAATLEIAQSYKPEHIHIMAGINDARHGYDAAELRELWQTICREPKIVITLAPPTFNEKANRAIGEINRIVEESCAGRTIVSLRSLGDGSGRLQQHFAADTSGHLGPDAYEVWRGLLKEHGV